MKTIYKYNIPIADRFTLQMPENSKPLTVQLQNETPVMWAFVDTKKEKVNKSFILVGSGHKFPGDFDYYYIGTFQMNGFVGHVFEEIK